MSFSFELEKSQTTQNVSSGKRFYARNVHHKCASQKKQNDTLSAVAIGTLSAPVSFCQKNQISPFATPKVRQGPTWNRHSSHIVLTPIIRLGGVDGSWLHTKTEFQFLLRQHQRQNCYHGTALRVKIRGSGNLIINRKKTKERRVN